MRPRTPSDNGRPHGGASPRRQPAPPELPPRRWVTALLCLLAMSWVFAFSSRPQVLATIPGVIGWLAVVERSRRFREVMLWLVVFGAASTVIGYQWLAQTVRDFGGVDVVTSWVLTALFGVWSTLHGWIFAVFYRGMLMRGRRPHPLLTVVLLAGCEALPIRMLAWSTGHGAVDVPPLLQAAEWGGVVAVSFVLLCLVVPIYEWTRWVFVRGGAAARPGAALVTFLVGVALYGFGMFRYAQVQTEEADATHHLRVAIVQPDVGSTMKRDATRNGGLKRLESAAAYQRGTERAAAEEAELIVWPETAITDAIPLQDALQTNQFLRGIGYGFVNDIGRDRAFLLGMYEQVTGRRSLVSGKRLQNRYNVAALRQPGDVNAPWSTYRKVHLIPFGETMPFDLYEDRLPQNFKMVAGSLPQPLLEYHEYTFAPFLCYEGILADYVREEVAGERPDVLVSLTNDSWFGDTWEPHQHLNFTRFRSVEHRAPMVRATNTGISAFVSATGDVEAELGVGVEGILVREVPIVDRGPTIYTRFGYRLPVLLWIVALAGWFLALMRPPPVVT